MSNRLPITAATSDTSRSHSLFPVAIAISIVIFYTLFTLLPNSSGLMVKWPWVFLWQVGLMLGPIALLMQLWNRSFRPLGGWLDWLAGAWCCSFVLSAAFAQFSHQAFWYSWAALCAIAFLYALNSWLTSTSRVERLLTFQGGLCIVFSSLSLTSWYLQTVRPYLQNIEILKGYGIETTVDLQQLNIQNWHPLGHQNYVAGYLLLTIPLLLGLALVQSSWRRIVWSLGFVLSLATLYSTSSRGSLFGLATSLMVALCLSFWLYPRLRRLLLSAGIIGLGLLSFWGFSTSRIRDLFSALTSQEAGLAGSSEFFYRVITNATGWYMGLDHPIFGAGLGSVTLLYQKYRPDWAGREAELTFQLHSTPAQLWAELGLIGVALAIASLVALAVIIIRQYRKQTLSDNTSLLASSVSPILLTALVSGLAGYVVYSLIDYQLDNICITGSIIIAVAVVISGHRPTLASTDAQSRTKRVPNNLSKIGGLFGIGIIAAVSIWLYPIHRAWMLSSQGFLALQKEDTISFVAYLERAHELSPWEPYYPYQLGWNLGELAFQSTDARKQEALRQESVKWFEKAIALSPNREFGYSNLGWLLVNSDPQKATETFTKAAKLVPRKNGIYFALGYSLLQEGELELAVQSMTVALIQQPILLTSPIWRSTELAALYSQVLTSLENYLQQQVSSDLSNSKRSAAYQTLGMLHWWQGDYDLAATAFAHNPTQLNDALLVLADTLPGSETAIAVSKQIKPHPILSVWAQLETSNDLLLRSALSKIPAYAYLDETEISGLIANIQASKALSSDFHNWLTQSGPSRQRRNQRLGFGTISRHIDGPLPRDFLATSENILITNYLSSLFPTLADSSDLESLMIELKTALSA
ncbi:O-antigen ligase family protein [cf. Phormidesmis sp. LEGE 11477]|uniref:O-antigen ligase family protein n=1 Tax=cf. Phormidesmis sp. LEGE 11477 TaxID=1828680 RepID=UPI0018818CA0|nr:O-antigen ligase family protein [cf. Phormidesmis sp. LEGE 11477]MBE9063601.1 O-antigen ligase family protein [cf. Phormidesmis sp. LEGE 11477]